MAPGFQRPVLERQQLYQFPPIHKRKVRPLPRQAYIGSGYDQNEMLFDDTPESVTTLDHEAALTEAERATNRTIAGYLERSWHRALRSSPSSPTNRVSTPREPADEDEG